MMTGSLRREGAVSYTHLDVYKRQVVVYDRIRENRTLMGKKASFEELVNHSVNQSARRTLITTITTAVSYTHLPNSAA